MKDKDHNLCSYFSYIGSKNGMAAELEARMPPEAYISYCEPFAGGAGLFLAKPKAKRNILNDLDPDVIQTHATVAAQPELVMAELEKLRPSRVTFNRLRDLRVSTGWQELVDAERAADFIYLTKCSVNGNTRSFSNSSKTNSNYSPHFDLQPYAGRFERVTFENLHWKELLHRLVFKPQDVTLFLYCDAPYVTSDSEKHYRFNFDAVEHVMLARALARINELNDGERRNVKLMISYDDDPNGFIRSLFRPEFGWWIETIKVNYDSEHRANRCRNELVIMNYDPTSVVSGNDSRAPQIDWSDVPCDGQLVGGRPFEELDCCEKERLSLVIQAKRRGRCRACGNQVVVDGAEGGEHR